MINDEQNFIGMDGFLWFYGVVEDRDDPYLIGRVKVRCFGHHTGNKDDLPTKDLPWAHVVLPVTSAGISGIGQSPTGLVEGSHVFGFFRDGMGRQEPVVLGSMPGYPIESADTEKGFYDPKGKYPTYIKAPDTSQLATMVKYNPDFHFSYVEMTEQVKRFQNIGTAVIEPMQLASAFISKGGGGFDFGFVTDFITSAVSNVIGANVLNTVGSTLGGFTESVAKLGDSISEVGNSFLKTDLGLSDLEIDLSNVNVSSFSAGKVRAQLEVPSLPSPDALTKAGLKQVGLTDAGQFKLDVVDPASMQKLFNDAASTDVLNNFNSAKTRVESGLSVIPGESSKVIDPTVLGIRGSLGTVETTEAQASAIAETNTQLQNTAGAASQGRLLTINDKITGVVTAVVEDIGQDSISATKTVLGDQGISIPQKSTTTQAGVKKIMNNFIAGNKDSWSMPSPPTPEDPYPKRHVYETESGHTMMYDDNDDFRTIQQRHASGTAYTIYDDGTKIDHIVSDQVTGIEGTSYTNIQEDQIVTLNGRYKILVNKDKERDNNYDIVVGENANINITVEKGDCNVNVKDGRLNMNCTDDFNMIVGGQTALITEGDYTINAGGKVTVQGKDGIYLN